ncbi:hypothetical protein ASE30_14995 [Achromobacter sp. Root83]|nr:hypothetical protein ASE30_14995 [Achromobacter sp. Root83]
MSAPSSARAEPAVLPAGAQAGDLIFRTGTEDLSAVVLAIDGGPFSHVGMLTGHPGDWRVLHATPSEAPGRRDSVVMDPLEYFIDRVRSRQHAVYHVHANDRQRSQAVSNAISKLGTPFAVADPAGIYCTVLVWEAWKHAGLDLEVGFTALNLPLLPGNYLLPGTLAASRRLTALSPVDTPQPPSAAPL